MYSSSFMHKVTLNLEDTILNALKLKATETNQSMSKLVNDALKASLQEDLEDIKSWEERKVKILTITKNL